MRISGALVLAIVLAAQDPRFGVQSRLVVVPVTVTDSAGRLVDSLDASDFLLLDDGRPRRVTVDMMDTGVAPVALSIAVQAAGISAPALDKIRKIHPMIQPLLTGERGCASVVSFSSEVQWLADCTNDPETLARAFGNLRPGAAKQARMLDAVHEAIGRLKGQPHSRRILVLMSESRDRGSDAPLDSVLLEAQAAGVTVYAITYSAFWTAFTSKPSGAAPAPAGAAVDIIGGLGEFARLGSPNTAQLLAAATGGATLPFTRQRGLEVAIERLSTELHTQYVLSFTPDGASPGHHRLECRITRPGAYKVRARPGYWVAAP